MTRTKPCAGEGDMGANRGGLATKPAAFQRMKSDESDYRAM